jgi:hypothetical protein
MGAFQLELPGVLSPHFLLLDPDVTLHPIQGEVDFGSGPVEGVHATVQRLIRALSHLKKSYQVSSDRA